jgi:hypothetical protein
MGSTAVWTPEKHPNGKGYGKPEFKEYGPLLTDTKKPAQKTGRALIYIRQAD